MPESADRPKKIVTVNQRDTIKQAAEKMLAHKIGCVIVSDDCDRFVGLVTEHDIAHHVAAMDGNCGTQCVSEIMTDQIISCAPGTPSSQVREFMTKHRIRHLPIVENGVVVGILSARDIMDQQLLEDRAAAEEVAMLSNCLKSIDLHEATEIVAAEAPKLFEAQNCVLCLYRDGDYTNEPELISASRCPCLDSKPIFQKDIQSLTDDGEYCREVMNVECQQCGGKAPRVVIPLDIVGLPEADSGKKRRLIGYLCMCGLSPTNAWNRELISYKAKLTKEIVTAHLSNATRYQQARLTSLTDPLTGVGSRKLLEDKLQSECDRARRYGRPFSVAIIDLDHFKMINDTLGHAIGDDAIRKLAACMDQEKRTPDVLARFGGDEFVILMPETPGKDSRVLLERIRIKVRQINVSEDISLSISCGVAQTEAGHEDPRDVMRRADLALYDAKNTGRNCVRLWNKDMARLLNTDDLEIEKIKSLQRRVVGLSEKAETMFMESIWGLVQALEAKDGHTKAHTENVMHYAVGIGQRMDLGPTHIELIRRAAMIHDIGKIGIPDAILTKPGDLTPHERRIIEQHPLIAVRILEKMSFLERELEIVRHHHEKWNGQGYPDGLARLGIPLGARILAAADTFDALTASRTYHQRRSVVDALGILMDSSGYELDPDVVKAFGVWIQEVADRCAKDLDKLVLGDLFGRVADPDQGDRSEVSEVPQETVSLV